MKYLSILTFAVFAVLYERVGAQDYNAYCDRFKESGPACFDERTLIVCTLLGNKWYGFFMAVCDVSFSLCCDATVMGCVVKNDCSGVRQCVNGELKEHDTNCTHYYYCSKNYWVEAICPAGVYDDYRKSCVFGPCNK